MAKCIKIMNYDGKKRTAVIDDFENVSCIIIGILSGDEVMSVIYKSGKMVVYDSTNDRLADFNDGVYPLYIKGELDRTEDKAFIDRATAYDGLDRYDNTWWDKM